MDAAKLSKARIIRRKLSIFAAMQNAQNVFESLQGHLVMSRDIEDI